MEDYKLRNFLNSIKENNKEKINVYFKKISKDYEGLIVNVTNEMFIKFPKTPLEFDDIKNIVTFELFRLSKEYDTKKGMHFATFIKNFLPLRVINTMKKFINKKHIIMNSRLDIEDENNIASPIEESLILSDYLMLSRNELSKREIKILNYIFNGYTLTEISKILDLSKQTISRDKIHIGEIIYKKLIEQQI